MTQPPRSVPRPKPPFVFKLAGVLLSTLLALPVIELGFRYLWLKGKAITAGVEHPHFHHRPKPNSDYYYTSNEFDVTIHTNRYGLRGPDPVLPKPSGVTRILMLGDSFTFGFPVKDDETFCRLIEQRLRAKGYPVEVVNGGVSGYSPTLEYVSLRDEYLSFEPDLVILWYDLGDLQEDTWYQKNLVRDAQGRIVRCDPAYINGRFGKWEWLKTHSAFARYLDAKVLRSLFYIRELGLGTYVATKLRGERAKVALARKKAAEQAADLASADRFLLVRETSTPEFLQPYWALSARYLIMIRDLLSERHVPLVLGLYPYGMLAGPDQWAQGRTFWGFEKGRTYDAGQALTIFRRFSDQERVPLVNTFPRFVDAAKREKLFYDWDGHMTSAGQRVVAEALVSDPDFLVLLQHRSKEVAQGAK